MSRDHVTIPSLPGYATFGDGYSEDQLDRIELVVGLEYDTETIFINMTGPTGQWFAVGFSDAILLTAQYGMENAYAIIVDWKREGKKNIDDDDIHEYFLRDNVLDQDDEEDKTVEVKTQYDQVQFRRNVLMERARSVSGSPFTFDKCPKEYLMVWSRGTYSPTTKLAFPNDTHNIYSRGLGTIKLEFNEGEEYDSMREACSGAMDLYRGMVMQIVFSVMVLVCVW